MKHLSSYLFFLATACMLSACSSSSSLGRLVGSDRDEHGCLGSGGYIWSEALHQCVRPWEAGERFDSGQQTAYLIFTADSTYAEVFTTTSHALCKRDKKKPYLWKSAKTNDRLSINNGVAVAYVGGTTYTKEQAAR